MVQIDAFLTYGLGSTLAFAAARRAGPPRASGSAPPDDALPLALTLAWLGAAFVPQTVYLLWRFPAWETMFAFRGHDDLPAWLAMGICALMVVMGAAGFVATTALVRRGRRGAARALAAAAYGIPVLLVTAGWDGTGHRRLLYPGTGEQWAAQVAFPPLAILETPLFHTLSWLVPLVMAPYLALLRSLSRRGPLAESQGPGALREARS